MTAGTSTEIFGADRHRFRLAPALTPAELLDLEHSVGVRLPEDYRSFLLEVGSGGAGPGLGLHTVTRGDDGWQWTGNDPTVLAYLGVAFPPFDASVRDDHEQARPVSDDPAVWRAWLDREDDLWVEESFGTLNLADQGCGHCWRLVVSGPHRGTVWDDARGSDVPLTPLTDPAGAPLSFRGWYLDWLDRW